MDIDQVLLCLFLMKGLLNSAGLKFKYTLENVYTSFPSGLKVPPTREDQEFLVSICRTELHHQSGCLF
jgi:hypothetical protein